MASSLKWIGGVGAFALASAGAVHASTPRFEQDVAWSAFYRGNTHTHSLRSDGDSAPEAVVGWYRDNGYQFVVLTDHNRAGAAREFASLETDAFRVITGEEASFSSPNPRGDSPKNLSVHVNALCSTSTVGGRNMSPVRVALQEAIDGIVAQPGAVAQINHPNYEWALTYDDILAATGVSVMEVANQHPAVANGGDARHPSVEKLWDRLLTAGKRIYGVASDDMHDLVRDPGFAPRRPGKGWVQVASDTFTDEGICAAIAAGRFYASTGVELSEIRVAGGAMELRIRAPEGELVTDFLGTDGKVLASVPGLSPRYELRAEDQGYVRALVRGPGGARAWVQPAWVAGE